MSKQNDRINLVHGKYLPAEALVKDDEIAREKQRIGAGIPNPNRSLADREFDQRMSGFLVTSVYTWLSRILPIFWCTNHDDLIHQACKTSIPHFDAFLLVYVLAARDRCIALRNRLGIQDVLTALSLSMLVETVTNMNILYTRMRVHPIRQMDYNDQNLILLLSSSCFERILDLAIDDTENGTTMTLSSEAESHKDQEDPNAGKSTTETRKTDSSKLKFKKRLSGEDTEKKLALFFTDLSTNKQCVDRSSASSMLAWVNSSSRWLLGNFKQDGNQLLEFYFNAVPTDIWLFDKDCLELFGLILAGIDLLSILPWRIIRRVEELDQDLSHNRKLPAIIRSRLNLRALYINMLIREGALEIANVYAKFEKFFPPIPDPVKQKEAQVPATEYDMSIEKAEYHITFENIWAKKSELVTQRGIERARKKFREEAPRITERYKGYEYRLAELRARERPSRIPATIKRHPAT